jgi:hypothetical protein
MGIHLMREMTDTLEHEAASGGGNLLRMLKKFPVDNSVWPKEVEDGNKN